DEQHDRPASMAFTKSRRTRVALGRRREPAGLDAERNDDALRLMVYETLRAGGEIRRRDHDARRPREDALEERAIEQPVLPTRPQHLTVKPEDKRSLLTRKKVRRQRQWIRLVNDREVALGTRERERKGRA